MQPFYVIRIVGFTLLLEAAAGGISRLGSFNCNWMQVIRVMRPSYKGLSRVSSLLSRFGSKVDVQVYDELKPMDESGETLGTVDFMAGECVQTEVFDNCAAPYETTMCWFIAVDGYSLIGLQLDEQNKKKATVKQWFPSQLKFHQNVKARICPLVRSKNINYTEVEINPEGEVKRYLFLYGIKVATNMAGISYHYHEQTCNAKHYVDYWLYGITHGHRTTLHYLPMDKFCPLAGVVTHEVRDILHFYHFRLWDKRNLQYDFEPEPNGATKKGTQGEISLFRG